MTRLKEREYVLINVGKGLFLAALLGASAAACRTKPNPESCLTNGCANGSVCNASTELCAGPDGGTDGGEGGGIFIQSPSVPTTYTNKTLPIVVGLAAGTPALDHVDILKGTAVLGTVTAPPYQFAWDTTQEAEGQYQISARAMIGTRALTAAAVTVIVDRKVPTVASQTPISGAGNVALSDPIEVVFSKALDPATVTQSAVTLSSPAGPLPASLSLSADGTTVSIVVTDRTSLVFPALITEAFASTVSDLAGNQLGTTPSSSWTAPQWVTLPSFPGSSSSLAIGPDDHPIVSFLTTAGVSLAKYRAGAAWDVSIPSPATGTVTAARVAVNMDSAPLLAWSTTRTSVARWNGTTWDNPFGMLPDSTTGGPVTGLQLAPSGDPVVAWSYLAGQMGTPTGEVAAWSQSAWQSLLSPSPAGVTGPLLLRVDSTGAPVVIGLGNGSFRLARYAGGSWLPIDTSGTAGTANSVEDALAIDSQDRPVVVSAVSQAPTTFRIQYVAAGVWTNLNAQLISTSATPPIEVDLAVDATGNTTLVWTETANSETNIRVARYSGGAWDIGYGTLSGFFGSNTDASGTNVVLDKVGAPIVAWNEGDGSGGTSVFMWRANR
ncbi:MAG TPA: Ig-like domain-containing protein [Polyangia bacterium]|nr:Ig-like domain-containing protein [Polyangia bacterium]